MIEIRLHDLTDGDRPMLQAMSAMFAAVAAGELTGEFITGPVPADIAKIAPEDAPDVGAPTAAEVFCKGFDLPAHEDDGALNPAVIFGGTPPSGVFPPPPANVGNVPAAPLPTASAPVNAAAPAPSIPPAPVPSGSTVELDTDGLPWDARIHASSKARNVDLRWRTKRHVDPALVATVTAELRTVMAIPGNVPPVPLAPIATVPVISTVAPTSAPAYAPPPVPVSLGNVPMPPAPPAAPLSASATASPAIAPIAQEPTGLTFPQLVPQITARLNDGRLTQETVSAVLGSIGLPSLPSLATRKDLVPTVAALLEIA